MLLEEFLKPTGISQYRLAKDIIVPACRSNKIAQGALPPFFASFLSPETSK